MAAICAAPRHGWGQWRSGELVRASYSDADTAGVAAEEAPDLGDTEGALAESDALADLNALLDADITQLAHTDIVAPSFSTPITTVERQESTVGRTAAAIYVITEDMIRRSGVRTIPDALRLAPGVHVAQIDANKWAISIRGFNGRFSNKLLVQIDGRTIYTPLFAGVFWDVQDVLLEDVARIEVIRGPGSAMWGANAVNGVINVITKSSRDTTGFFAESGGGNERLFASARVGGETKNGSWRFFTKWFDRDAGRGVGFEPADDWQLTHLGFRIDQRVNSLDEWTIQGDYYNGDAGTRAIFPLATPPFLGQGADPQTIGGGNILCRYSRRYSADDQWTLQFYYDQTIRHLHTQGFREQRHTVDVDFQRQLKVGLWHRLVWGMAYRNTADTISNDGLAIKFFPNARAINRYSVFAQDQMTMIDDLFFVTLGSKFSYNDFSGFEIQPTLRLLYTPTASKTVWASVSRAVRVPARVNQDLHLTTVPVSVPFFPAYPQFRGDPNLDSETLLAYELGMRSSPTKEFYWDIATFYNRYNHLDGFLPRSPGIDPVTGLFVLPFQFVNGVVADTVGGEFTTSLQLTDAWQLRAAYSLIAIDVDAAPGVTLSDPTQGTVRNIAYFHSSWDIGNDIDFDLMGRWVDSMKTGNIPSYFEIDTRIAWRPNDVFEFSLIGRNLLDCAHPEYESDVYAGALATEVQRELYGQAVWRY